MKLNNQARFKGYLSSNTKSVKMDPVKLNNQARFKVFIIKHKKCKNGSCEVEQSGSFQGIYYQTQKV